MPYVHCPQLRSLGSEYVMDPGARLELGPHGTPYEELGACSCATSGIDFGGRRPGARAGLGQLHWPDLPKWSLLSFGLGAAVGAAAMWWSKRRR